MQRKILKSLKKIIAANVWYHGRTVKSQVFDEEKTGNGNDLAGTAKRQKRRKSEKPWLRAYLEARSFRSE